MCSHRNLTILFILYLTDSSFRLSKKKEIRADFKKVKLYPGEKKKCLLCWSRFSGYVCVYAVHSFIPMNCEENSKFNCSNVVLPQFLFFFFRCSVILYKNKLSIFSDANRVRQRKKVNKKELITCSTFIESPTEFTEWKRWW